MADGEEVLALRICLQGLRIQRKNLSSDGQ
jgi:hypothetical protein